MCDGSASDGASASMHPRPCTSAAVGATRSATGGAAAATSGGSSGGTAPECAVSDLSADVDCSGMGYEEMVAEWARPEVLHLCLMYNRITTITHLHQMAQLQTLNLRSNRITSIQGLEGCASLRELELYENRLSRIEGLDALSKLELLDLSFNEITRMENLEALSSLTTLFLAQNQVCIPPTHPFLPYVAREFFSHISHLAQNQVLYYAHPPVSPRAEPHVYFAHPPVSPM